MGPFDTLEAAIAFDRTTHADRRLNQLAYSLPCADGSLTMAVRPDGTTTEYPPPEGSNWGYHVLRPGEVADTTYETRYMAHVTWASFPAVHQYEGFLGCPWVGVEAPWLPGGQTFDLDDDDGWCRTGLQTAVPNDTYNLRRAMGWWRSRGMGDPFMAYWDEVHHPEVQWAVVDAPPYRQGEPIPALDVTGRNRQGANLQNVQYTSGCWPIQPLCTNLSWRFWWGSQVTPPPANVPPNGGARIAIRQTVWCPQEASGFAFGEPRLRACRLHTGHGNLAPPLCVNAGATTAPENAPNVPLGLAIGSHIVTDTRQTDSCPEGNPCYPGTGNKSVSEVDFEFEGLRFARHYNSLRQLRAFASIDQNWVHSLSARLISPAITRGDITPAAFSCSASQIWMQTERNLLERFVRLNDGQFRSDNALGQVLNCEQDVAWTLLNRDGSTDIFDWTGKLVERRIPDRPNQGFTLEWLLGQDDLHRISAVQFASGRRLDFHYTRAADNHYLSQLQVITNAAGEYLVSYDYHPNGALANVHLPDNVIRSYAYGEPDAVPAGIELPYHLTSIREGNTLYARYAYDTHGRAVSSEHADGSRHARC
jgi:hypothetical protein